MSAKMDNTKSLVDVASNQLHIPDEEEDAATKRMQRFV